MELEDLALLLAFGAITEEEAALFLLEIITSQNDCDDGYRHFNTFNVDNFTSKQCKLYFCFTPDDLERLGLALKLDEEYCTPTRIKWGKMEGLCLLLRRLAYPNRLCDIEWIFGRHKTVLSTMLNVMLEDVYAKHADKLSEVDQPWLDIQEFCEAVENRCGIDCVWGFLDGTLKGICRPGINQEVTYSGHKRKHGLKYQALSTPNGLIAHCYGPVEGRRHDSGMYQESGLDQQLQQIFLTTGKAIYGDSAYANKAYLWTPFKSARISRDQQEFNTTMSTVRESVEWSFGKLSSIFGFIDFHKNQKVYLQPVAKYFLVSTLLCNAHTCVWK
jgi:hypothetical protein